jgi:hypothetical protein
MESKGAEVTATEASSVMSERKLNLGDSRYTALLLIRGMIISHKGKSINLIKLFSLKRGHRRILHEHLIPVIFD